MLDTCKDTLKKLNSNMNPENVCVCDYEPGEYVFPTLKLPVKNQIFQNNQAVQDYLMKSARNVSIDDFI